jgi:hypothetical protein
MLLVIEEARSKGRKARRGMMERFSPEIVARIVAGQIQQAHVNAQTTELSSYHRVQLAR